MNIEVSRVAVGEIMPLRELYRQAMNGMRKRQSCGSSTKLMKAKEELDEKNVDCGSFGRRLSFHQPGRCPGGRTERAWGQRSVRGGAAPDRTHSPGHEQPSGPRGPDRPVPGQTASAPRVSDPDR